jgi:hypothetical protein
MTTAAHFLATWHGAEIKAALVAMEVRNAMEDFHCEHLSDSQMAILNPIIRNAIMTALEMHEQAYIYGDLVALESVSWTLRMIPDYWEKPESEWPERRAQLAKVLKRP